MMEFEIKLNFSKISGGGLQPFQPPPHKYGPEIKIITVRSRTERNARFLKMLQ